MSLATILVNYCINDPNDCQAFKDAQDAGNVDQFCLNNTGNTICTIYNAQSCDDLYGAIPPSVDYMKCVGARIGQANPELTQCQAKADLDTQGLDDLVSQLQSGWNPTAFFTSQIIIELVGRWNERSQQARSAVASAQSKVGDSGLLRDRLDSLDTVDKQAQTYLQAAQDAGTDGIVQADKLKAWAIDGLRAASDALHAAEVTTCVHDQDWGPLVALGQFFWTVGGIAADTAQAAYQAGKKIVKASEWLLGAFGWILTHPWTVFGGIALVVGGMFAYKHRDTLKGTFTRFKRS